MKSKREKREGRFQRLRAQLEEMRRVALRYRAEAEALYAVATPEQRKEAEPIVARAIAEGFGPPPGACVDWR